MTSLEWTVAENVAPRYYPDAVTLTPDATAADVLDRVRAGRPRAGLAAVAAAFPGCPVVGYEHGDDLRIALDHGAEPLGPLRVWVR